ncbi:MAG: hypothetical protein IH987_03420 [Planctomycetes bacterium]|nr:hypothetical protein [Planctomycetota bacterium]
MRRFGSIFAIQRQLAVKLQLFPQQPGEVSRLGADIRGKTKHAVRDYTRSLPNPGDLAVGGMRKRYSAFVPTHRNRQRLRVLFPVDFRPLIGLCEQVPKHRGRHRFAIVSR